MEEQKEILRKRKQHQERYMLKNLINNNEIASTGQRYSKSRVAVLKRPPLPIVPTKNASKTSYSKLHSIPQKETKNPAGKNKSDLF